MTDRPREADGDGDLDPLTLDKETLQDLDLASDVADNIKGGWTAGPPFKESVQCCPTSTIHPQTQ